MTKLQEIATSVSDILRRLATLVDDATVQAWEESFANQQKALRYFIGQLIVGSGAGRYSGTVGDHTLTLCGVTAHVEDGYRALLRAWFDEANKVPESAKAGAA